MKINQSNNITIIPNNTTIINGVEHVLFPWSALLNEIPLKPAPVKYRKQMAENVISEFSKLLARSGFPVENFKYNFPKSYRNLLKYETVNMVFNNNDFLTDHKTVDLLFQVDRRSLANPVNINNEMNVSYNIQIETLKTLINEYEPSDEYVFLKKIYWDLVNFKECLLNIIQSPDFNKIEPLINFQLDDNTLNFEFIFPAGILPRKFKDNKLKAAINIDGNLGGLYKIYTKDEKELAELLTLINTYPANERTFTQVTNIIEFELFDKFGIQILESRLQEKLNWLNEPTTILRKARIRKEKIQNSINQ